MRAPPEAETRCRAVALERDLAPSGDLLTDHDAHRSAEDEKSARQHDRMVLTVAVRGSSRREPVFSMVFSIFSP